MNKNIVITKFMGLTPTLVSPDVYVLPQPWLTIAGNTPEKVFEEFAERAGYADSYEWLMPVVEKLESLGCMVEIKSHYHPYEKKSSFNTLISKSDYSHVSSTGCGASNYRFVSGNGVTRLESIYVAVVKAIETLIEVK